MTDKTRSREERRKQLKNEKSKKTKKKSGWFKKIMLTLLFLIVAGLIAGIGLFAYYVSSAPELDESLLKDPVSSKIYDSEGNLITEVGVENRDYVTFDEIPEVIVDAVLATEDSRFYEHHGVDVLRLASAVVANFTDGFGSQGASTITQQLVKRSFLTDEKSLKRKAQELWLSFQIERKYSKEEIFEMYINKIFYGERANGVATAAQTYFGKSLDELELYEAATLAGLPQSPSRYNPFNNPEGAETRRNVVLTLMNRHGYITEAEMKDAQSVPIESTLLAEEDRKNDEDLAYYNSFIDQVIEEVEDKTNYNIFTDGLEVYTTIDADMQSYVYELLNSDESAINFPDDELQAGVVLLDTTSGEIKAIGGGRNQTGARTFNYATDIDRQPGSTIKPILDYGPAIEYLRWSTYEQVVDEAYSYSDGTPINNYNDKYHGQMSIRTALAKSYNIPALKAFQAVGNEKAQAFAENLGLEFDENIYEPASIGGLRTGFSPLDMAGAYSAFGNEGVYNEPHTVTKVVLQDKTTTLNLKPESKVVMQDYTAFMISDMLKSVMTEGTGTAANISGLPVAGKTGTTNYSDDELASTGFPSSGVPDSWMVGYTTQFTTAVWTGYENRTTDYLSTESQQLAKKIFKYIMTEASKDVTTSDFKKPSSVVKSAVEVGSNPAALPSENTPSDKITYEYFVKGTEPTTVSQSYEAIDPVTNLQVQYNEVTNELHLTWKYPTDDEDDSRPSFNVSATSDSEGDVSVSLSGEMEARVSNPTPGAIYNFSVTATVGSVSSDPATISIQVPGSVEEDTDEEQPEEGSDTEEPADENTDSSTDESNPSDNSNSNDENNGTTDSPENNPSNNDTAETNNNNNGDQNSASMQGTVDLDTQVSPRTSRQYLMLTIFPSLHLLLNLI